MIGAVFVFAGISKLLDPIKFIDVLESIINLSYYPLLIGSYIFSLVEIAIGLLIVFKPVREVLYVSTGFLSVFCIFLLWQIMTYATPDCGCYGSILNVTNKQQLLNDVALLMGTIYLLY
ncbi:hypothetical protein AMJ80_02660 [bacterium SM23_31]|nr:MAG: hypothetical protein AMJ80_02660 [bacterium SM23_31]